MKIIRFIDSESNIRLAGTGTNGRYYCLEGDIYDCPKLTRVLAEIKKALAPVKPVQILCIGANYKKHIEEGNSSIPAWPVLFMKGLGAVQHPDDPVLLPRFLRSEKVDYEGELAVVIGKSGKNIREEDALDYVLGYTCANDISARDWQTERGGGQWCRGKGFDTFAPLGPCLVTKDDIPDPNNLSIKTVLNNEVVQNAHTSEMIFSVTRIISFLSGSTTLLPGTVILTGTPHGVGAAASPPRWLTAGDVITVEIENIGRLSNPVVEEPVIAKEKKMRNA